MALLEIKGLTKKYGTFTAASEVTFQVGSGEIVALIGENGAGKTTVLNCLAGSIKASAGTVAYKGQSLLEKESLRSEFGFLIQAGFFEYMNAYDNLKILLKLTGQYQRAESRKEILELLELVGLTDKKDKYVKTFSFGMKQRLGLAQALINRPHFLALDEPFVGLDPIGKRTLKKVIRQKAGQEGAGVLFSSHDLEDVEEICDRVVMLQKGRVVYNDVFRTAKRYVICMGSGGEAEKLAAGTTGVKREEGNVICPDFAGFQEAYRRAAQEGLDVRDVDIREDSLYRFFEGREIG